MVGLVIVSHSAALAEGIVELAREMGGNDVAIEAAGGLQDPPGALGTDAERVMRALERVRSPDGVLVLMDLGSALMSAEMAVEMTEGEGRILLSGAPLVEGAVAAAARARTGATLDEVAADARSALNMKTEQLGDGETESQAPEDPPPGADGAWDSELRLTVANRLGLHARPAARLVGTASGFQADVSVANVSRDRGPVDARSLIGLVTLSVRRGDEILVRARGAQAAEVLSAVGALAADSFGDPEDGAPPARAASPEPGASQPARSEPPPAGTQLRGVPAASGIAIGLAWPLARPMAQDDDRPAESPEAEQARLDSAIGSARADLVTDRESMAQRAGEAEAAIFDAHLLLLDDAALLDPARASISTESVTAGAAWRSAAEAVVETYRELEDPYLRERAVDVKDVAARVIAHLTGTSSTREEPEGIVVAGEFTPGQAARLDPARVTGIAAARGGATSHAAILARALAIPAVVGLGDSLLGVEPGTMLVLDGDGGTVRVDPGAEAIAEGEDRRESAERQRLQLTARAAEPGRTQDGHRVEVLANLSGSREVRAAVESGAEGVGLLRTEFLFLEREHPPDEEEQEAVYREVAEGLDGRPLILRTLDAGADKPLPFLRQAPEDNPFLGLRGIRLSLREPMLLRAQLRAALRVAADHPLKVMFPMVTTLAEYRAARALLEEEATALGRPPGLEVGVMVEVPAVALSAERFAREVDFFSIGTNDLAQYTMAAERGNEHVADLLAGPLPTLLQLISQVVAGAEAHGRWVGACGELAGDPAAAILLAGLGVSELSMAAGRIPAVKHALRSTDLAAAREAARCALSADTAEEASACAAGVSTGL